MSKKINQREKGHRLERDIAAKFREMGWDECCTSRSESKRLDDMGIDLCYTNPFWVQCKAVESLNVHKVLNEMPDKKGLYNIVVSKKSRQGTLVAMSWETFAELVGMMKREGIL